MFLGEDHHISAEEATQIHNVKKNPQVRGEGVTNRGTQRIFRAAKLLSGGATADACHYTFVNQPLLQREKLYSCYPVCV